MPGMVRSPCVAVDAEGAQAARRLAASPACASDEHAALAGRDVLDRIEREAAGVAEQADMRAVAARADGERAVLDDVRPCAAASATIGWHVARDADEVDDRDRLRPRRDAASIASAVMLPVGGSAVDEHGAHPPLDRVRRRRVRLRGQITSSPGPSPK